VAAACTQLLAANKRECIAPLRDAVAHERIRKGEKPSSQRRPVSTPTSICAVSPKTAGRAGCVGVHTTLVKSCKATSPVTHGHPLPTSSGPPRRCRPARTQRARARRVQSKPAGQRARFNFLPLCPQPQPRRQKLRLATARRARTGAFVSTDATAGDVRHEATSRRGREEGTCHGRRPHLLSRVRLPLSLPVRLDLTFNVPCPSRLIGYADRNGGGVHPRRRDPDGRTRIKNVAASLELGSPFGSKDDS
jgi:hypothetical protein